jgi:hypothetical protein
MCVIGLVFATAGACADKGREWRSGTILESTATEAYTGDVQPGVRSRNYDFSPEGQQGPPRRSLIFVPAYGVRESYVIESQGEKFVAMRVYQPDKPSSIASMRNVKFAVEKKTIIILDDKGRKHKFKRPAAERR